MDGWSLCKKKKERAAVLDSFLGKALTAKDGFLSSRHEPPLKRTSTGPLNFGPCGAKRGWRASIDR